MNKTLLVVLVAAVALAAALGHLSGDLEPTEEVAELPPIESPIECPEGLESGDWVKAAGRIYVDVGLYSGEGDCKQFMGKIWGGTSEFIRIDSPTERRLINRSEITNLYVKSDDRALKYRKLWRSVD